MGNWAPGMRWAASGEGLKMSRELIALIELLRAPSPIPAQIVKSCAHYGLLTDIFDAKFDTHIL